jgi:ABC-type dipeptide/oligopeptide/nickel transport system permease component
VVHGNLGLSLRYNQASASCSRNATYTLKLTLSALLVAVLPRSPGVRRRAGARWDDRTISVVSLFGLLFCFASGLILILLFSIKMGWLPALACSRNLVLPAITMAARWRILTRMVAPRCSKS